MNNYKMIISYDGTRYYGWEHQPNTDMTIQGKLECVLSQMVNEAVEVIGAGRTDAGNGRQCSYEYRYDRGADM